MITFELEPRICIPQVVCISSFCCCNPLSHVGLMRSPHWIFSCAHADESAVVLVPVLVRFRVLGSAAYISCFLSYHEVQLARQKSHQGSPHARMGLQRFKRLSKDLTSALTATEPLPGAMIITPQLWPFFSLLRSSQQSILLHRNTHEYYR